MKEPLPEQAESAIWQERMDVLIRASGTRSITSPLPSPSYERIAGALAKSYCGALPDERPEALEYLDFAISEFREMKMQPSLERALWHRGLLRA